MKLLELTFPKFKKNNKWMREKQNATFGDWLKERVANQMRFSDNDVLETIRWMAGSLKNEVPSFASYGVNGVDFNTKHQDNTRTVQNSGVFLVAHAMQVASAEDQNLRVNDMDFYGVIKSIWEVDYYKFRIPVFKCDWVESTRGVKVDELGFTLVKLNRIGHVNYPFVLATHVKQIFYIQDPIDAEWSVVVKCSDRDYHGVDDEEELHDIEVEESSFVPTVPLVNTFDDVDGHQLSIHMRDGDEGIWVDNES